MDDVIEMPFASMTLVGPGKHLLHIMDCFGRILYCVHSTQYSLLVYLVLSQYMNKKMQIMRQHSVYGLTTNTGVYATNDF